MTKFSNDDSVLCGNRMESGTADRFHKRGVCVVSSFLSLTSAVISTGCVMIVIAYLLIQKKTSLLELTHTTTLNQQLFLSAIFGSFSLYAALNAIPAYGAVVSLRHTGALLAGFIGGPAVGLAVGLIGGVHRYLQGGPSVRSAVLAGILAGLLAGIYARYRRARQELISTREAVVFTICFEIFAGSLTFLFVPDFAQALLVEKNVRLPLIIGNTLAVGVFLLFVHNLLEEQHIKSIKEQIEYELNVARSIQMSMVPKIFPTPPEVPEFDVFAVLQPAKEVGGDFYDFFYIDNNRFCFIVGDVSGKGVPASLFMAVTKTLIQAKADPGVSCAEIFHKVNNELCRNNSETMFVTVCGGILDIRTGEIEMCNAGHPPPYICNAGSVRAVRLAPCVAFGIMEDVPYHNEKLTLAKGHSLVLYTDGVTEAVDACDIQFSESRLEEALIGCVPKTTKEMTRCLVTSVETFAAGMPQYDDITVLTLTYLGVKEAQA